MLVLQAKYIIGGVQRDVVVILRGEDKTRFSIAPKVLDQIPVA
jgi:hypothetical protein